MTRRWGIGLSHWWLAHAGKRGWWSVAARPVAWLYRWLAQQAHARALQQREDLPVPVVIVGNVLVGGTGKTPIVAAVVAHLLALGMRPGVVARGYKAKSAKGRSAATPILIDHQRSRDAQHAAADCGDEPLLLFELTQVPVCVHHKRLLAAQYLLSHHPAVNVIVSDDGLQHAALPRNVELVVFDERGIGNGQMLPAGLLREPWPSRTSQLPAGQRLVVQNGVTAPNVMPSDALNPVFRSERQLGELIPLLPVDSASGQCAPSAGSAVQVLAGIAKPNAFADMLRAKGYDVQHVALVADHDPLDSDWPTGFGLNPALPTICTAKDAVKLRARADAARLNVWVAPLFVSLPPAFWKAFDVSISPFKSG